MIDKKYKMIRRKKNKLIARKYKKKMGQGIGERRNEERMRNAIARDKGEKENGKMGIACDKEHVSALLCVFVPVEF